jgi:hypothetical protein
MTDIEEQIAVETARLSTSRYGSVHSLRELEESRACEILGIRPVPDGLVAATRERVCAGIEREVAELACTHLRNAEGWQWEVGSYSTGAGEGFMSMGKVYTLKLTQAWLQAACGDAAQAHALMAEIEGDPNRLGQRFASEIAALRAWLARA